MFDIIFEISAHFRHDRESSRALMSFGSDTKDRISKFSQKMKLLTGYKMTDSDFSY